MRGSEIGKEEGGNIKDDEEDTQANQCLNCGQSGSNLKKLMRCSACKSAYFCNLICQKKCWKDHKIDCVEVAGTVGKEIIDEEANEEV